MEATLDRFEGDYAILELDVGKMIEIPKILVGNAKEGDVIKIIVDKEATKRRKKNIEMLVDDLFE